MSDVQTEARAIAPERIWATGSFHMGGYASGSWNVQKLSNSRTDLGEVEYVRADIHATALAAKDADLDGWKNTATEYAAELHVLRAQLAEANKALEEIADAKTELTNRHDYSRGWNDALFRVRQIARRAREAQGGENA